MNTDTAWQPNVHPATLSGELATSSLTRSTTVQDLLLLATSHERAGVETTDQLKRLRTELGGLGVKPITWDCPNQWGDCVTEGPTSRALFRRALALRGFHWGRRFDYPSRSKRGIVLGGGASLHDKLAVKAGIEAVVGIHGLIAFYVADDTEGDSSYIGADGDLALFGRTASLRGTDSNHAVNRFSSASIHIEQSSGICESPALATEIAVAIARVLHALMPARAAL